ncbi:MAG: GAF domain-containing protein [Chloroflexota bacterium]
MLRASTGYAGTKLLDAGHELPITQNSLNGTAVISKQAVIVADTRNHAMFLAHPLLPNTRSEMVIPLIVGERVVGVLDLQSDQVESLTEENLPAFTVLAGQLAIAIRNATLFSERDQAVKALQDSQARFALAVQGSNDGILEWNIPANTFYMSPRVKEMLGYEDHEIPNEADNFENLIHPENHDQVMQTMNDALTGKLANYELEMRLQHKDGSYRWILSRGVLLRAEDGTPLRIGGSLSDITERKQTEVTLREEQARTQTLLQSIAVPMLISRASDGKIYYANEHLADVLLVPVEELMSKGTPNFYVDPADRVAVVGEIQREGFVSNYELRMRRANDDIFWSLLSARLINFSGEIAIITSLIDITDRAVAEATSAKQAADLQTVADLSAQVTSIQDPQHLLEVLVQETRRRFDLYHCHVFLLDGDNLKIQACGWHEGAVQFGSHGDTVIPVHAERSLVAQAVRTRKPVVVNDVYNDPHWLPNELLPDTRSEIAIPLVVGNEILGVLDAQAAVVNRFTEQDVQIQTTLAAQIAVALQNARQFTFAQEALEDAKTFRQLVAASSESIGMADLQGVVTYANPALLEMVGAEKLEDLVGQAMFPLYPPEIQQRFMEEIIPTVLQKGDWQGELRMEANGRTIATYEDYFLLRDEAGNPTQFVAIISDITEQKQREEAARQNETLMRTIIDSTPDWIFVKDTEHRYRMVNKGYADFLHRSPDEFIGKDDIDLGYPEELIYGDPEKGTRGIWNDDQEVMDSGQLKTIDHDTTEIEGELRFLNTIKAPLKDGQGNVTGIVVYVHDITNQMQAQQTQTMLARELEERLEQVNALQRAMTREGWQAFLTADERSVQGFMFSGESMLPISANPLNEQLATAAPIPLEEITDVSFNETRTAVSIPLNLHGESIGVIGARNASGAPLDDEQQALLTAFSQQVAEALERARLFEETEIGRQQLDRRAQELTAINEVAQSVSQQLDPEQLLETIYRQVQRILPADAFIVALYDEAKNTLSYPMVYDEGKRFEELPGPPKPNTQIYQVLHDGKPRIVNRTREQVDEILFKRREREGYTLGDEAKISASLLYVPLQIGPRIAGVMSIQSYQFNAYGEQETDLLIGIANHVAVALENARLYAEAQLRAEQMALINHLAETVAQQLDPNQVLDTVYQQVQEVIPTGAFIVGLWDEQSGMVHYPMVYDQGERFDEVDAPPVPGSYMEQILQTGEPILVNYTTDEIAELEHETFASLGQQKRPNSIMFVPLYSGVRVTGAISLQNYEGHQYNQSDIQLLSGIANHVTVALENARLFTQTEQRAAELAIINAVSEVASSQLNLPDLFNGVGNLLHDTFNAESVYIALYDRQKELITFPYFHSSEDGLLTVAPCSINDGGLTAKIVESRAPLLRLWEQENPSEDAVSEGAKTVGNGRYTDCYLGVPMIVGNEVIGVLAVSSYQAIRAYQEPDQRLLGILAGTISVAVQNIQQFHDTQRRAEREALVNAISQKIQSAPTIENALQTAVSELGQALKAKRAFVKLVQKTGQSNGHDSQQQTQLDS